MIHAILGWLAGLGFSNEHYEGDVYDTPPAIIRAAMTGTCVFGAIIMVWSLLVTNHIVALILGLGGLVITLLLIWSVPRASQTAMVTVLFWGLVGFLVVFLPS